jgi:hypothetical protein
MGDGGYMVVWEQHAVVRAQSCVRGWLARRRVRWMGAMRPLRLRRLRQARWRLQRAQLQVWSRGGGDVTYFG